MATQRVNTNGFVTFETGQREPVYGKDEVMSCMGLSNLAGRLLLLAALLVISDAPVAAQVRLSQANTLEITTDTREYCHELLTRVSDLMRRAAGAVPREVADLTSEGRHMCDHGQTRSGIMRVRSALMLMEKPDGPTYR